MKTATAPLPPLRSVKVLDQLRERIRYLHYSLRTEQAYVNWVRAFIRFHGVRHPATLGSSEVEAFLSWLANERKVSVSTHRQALAALLFFYGKVLCTDLPWLQEIGRPRPSRRLPVVLTPDEVVRILGFLEGEHRLFAQLLYGTGMRISEGLQLRVKVSGFRSRHDHRAGGGTVAKLAMRQPFVLFKGLTFQKLCLPGAFRPGDHHNKMLRPGLCVVHASPQYL
ncbi:DNA integrase protein IntI1 (plasmid) [Escherichia coli UMNF18]|nr:DNA integrase protein IntI1 [Escherichia coli UMNF18]